MKKLLSILLVLLLVSSVHSFGKKSNRIRLYCCYTPSHAVLKDEWFLPSLKDNFELKIEFFEQESPTAAFKEEGWTKTTLRKIDMIIRAIEENWGKIFVYSDVDIQFFRPVKSLILKAIEGKDLVIQRNNPKGEACSGFFACHANERVLNLFKKVRGYMARKNKSDQISLNRFIRKSNPFNVVWSLLPYEFFGCGTISGKRWKIGDFMYVPKNIVLHHANYTKGVPNKISQLIYVKNYMMSKTKENEGENT